MPAGTSAESYGLRVAGFYGALFLIYGIHLPFLPLWLDHKGLDAQEIAVVTAVPFLLRLLVTPTLAFAADRHGAHRQIIVALAWLAVAAVSVMSLMSGFWPLLATAVLLSLAMTTIMPLTEVVATAGVRRHGLDYGRMRLWGSATFILANLSGAAIIASLGAGSIAALIAAGCLATAVAAHLLPADPGKSATAPATAPQLQAAEPPIQASEALRLLGSPPFLLFLLACGATHASHATLYAFGSLHWQAAGLSPAYIGALWAIGVIAEIALFAHSATARRLGAKGLLVIAALAAVVRWACMAADPPAALLVPLQILHGLTFGAAHLGAIAFLSQAAPERISGTAQALYATVAMGIAMGAATLASGSLYAAYSGGAFLAMAGLGVVASLAAVALAVVWRGGLLAADPRQP